MSANSCAATPAVKARSQVLRVEVQRLTDVFERERRLAVVVLDPLVCLAEEAAFMRRGGERVFAKAINGIFQDGNDETPLARNGGMVLNLRRQERIGWRKEPRRDALCRTPREAPSRGRPNLFPSRRLRRWLHFA